MRTLTVLAVAGILAASTVGGASRHDESWWSGQRQTFGPWSRPVNLGPIVNSTVHDQTPAISRDGLSLYFASDRAGGSGGFDLWVSQRLATDLPWEAPVNLGPAVNTPANDNGPSLSPDGRQLFFVSNRPGLGACRPLHLTPHSLERRLRLGHTGESLLLEHSRDRRCPELFREPARPAAAVLHHHSTRWSGGHPCERAAEGRDVGSSDSGGRDQ